MSSKIFSWGILWALLGHFTEVELYHWRPVLAIVENQCSDNGFLELEHFKGKRLDSSDFLDRSKPIIVIYYKK